MSKLIDDIKSLEGLFDLVMQDSEDRLRFKSSELIHLQEELARWRTEALRRQAEAEAKQESDRSEFAATLSAKMEDVRLSYEAELKKKQDEFEILLGERDRWKSEVERLNRELRKKDANSFATVERLRAEVKMLKAKVDASKTEISVKDADSSEKTYNMASEVVRWKEEFYKQRVFSEQKSQVLQDKVGQLTDEVKRWKDKLYQQKLEFESELKKRNAIIDKLRNDIATGTDSAYPDSHAMSDQPLQQYAYGQPQSAAPPVRLSRLPSPPRYGEAVAGASSPGATPYGSNNSNGPNSAGNSVGVLGRTSSSASLGSPVPGGSPAVGLQRSGSSRSMFKTAVQNSSAGLPGSSPNLTPRSSFHSSDRIVNSATTPQMVRAGTLQTAQGQVQHSSSVYSEDFVHKIEKFGGVLDDKTSLVDSLIARVMRLQDELYEDRAQIHPVLSTCQSMQRQLADRTHSLELEFRTDVTSAFEKVNQLMMDAERWKSRLERASGLTLPSVSDSGSMTMVSDTVDITYETPMVLELRERIQELLGELSRWKWEAENAHRKLQKSSKGAGRLSPNLNRVDELLNRISNLEVELEENRSRGQTAESETAKWKDIALLMLPLMELLNKRSVSADSASSTPIPGAEGEEVVERALTSIRSGNSFLPMLETLLERALAHTMHGTGAAQPAVSERPPWSSNAAAAHDVQVLTLGSPTASSKGRSPSVASVNRGSPGTGASLLDPGQQQQMSLSFSSSFNQNNASVQGSSGFYVAGQEPNGSSSVSNTSAVLGVQGNASSAFSPATPPGSEPLMWTYSQPPAVQDSFVQAFIASRIDEAVFGIHGAGHLDGYVKRAAFNMPYGVTSNRAGTLVFVTEHGNHCVRKINLSDGLVVTVTNVAQGSKKNSLSQPAGLAISGDESHLLVADSKRNSVLRVDIRSGATLLIAGLPSIRGKHSVVNDLIADDEDHVYVSHTRGISKLHLKSRVFSDVCSNAQRGWQDGPLDHAMFNNPTGICFLSPSELLVADTENHRIRLVDLRGRRVSTFAGCGYAGHDDGPAQQAQFNMPIKLAYDSTRGVVFVTEAGDHIRVVDIYNRLVSTIQIAQFNVPAGICWIPSRHVLAVADTFNHGVRILSFADLQSPA
eukprot:ANDGO_02623.mRNA.1 hypothetical protein